MRWPSGQSVIHTWARKLCVCLYVCVCVCVCVSVCVCVYERERKRELEREQKNLANVIPLWRYKREQSQCSAHTMGRPAACSYPLDGWFLPCRWIIVQQQQASLPQA